MKLIGPPERPEGLEFVAAPPPDAPVTAPGTRVVLVRHAEVADEVVAVAYGALDVDLSPAGTEATRRLGAAFAGQKVDRVISSDLRRALEMGRAIAAGSGAELIVTPALREVDRGRWQGIPRRDFIANWEADAKTYWRDPWNWKSHGGDSDADLWKRGGAALVDGLIAVNGGTLVVTAHTNLIRVMLGVLLRVPTPLNYAFETGPAHLHLLTFDGEAWVHSERNLASPPPA
ncbi:MAG: histidine phosphatase family protein [Planctomycetes bacterium]|nr:histidine phosphatase family protein [Planctomycetota bacterium]